MSQEEGWPNKADNVNITVKRNPEDVREDLSWLGEIEAPDIIESKRPLWFACHNHQGPMAADLLPSGGSLLLVLKYEHAPGSDFKIKGRYRSCDICPKPCRYILEVLRG